MKRLTYLYTILLGVFLSAQDLTHYIPYETSSLVTFRGKAFQKHITLEELNESKLGKKVINYFIKEQRQQLKLEDLGLNYDSNFYYFAQKTDSAVYNGLWIPILDASRFEKIVSQRLDQKIDQNSKIKNIWNDDVLISWDNEKALIIHGKINKDFFDDSIKAAKYGLKEVLYEDFYYPEDSVVMRRYDRNYPPIDSVVAKTENDSLNNETKPNLDVEWKSHEEEKIEIQQEEEDENDPCGNKYLYREYHDQEKYDQERKKQDKQKEQILKDWINQYTQNLFENKLEKNISTNPNYIKTSDKEAPVSYFVDMSKIHHEDFYFSLLYATYFWSPHYYFLGNSLFYGKFLIEQDRLKVSHNYQLAPKQSNYYEDIYSRNLNRKFLKYIHEDNLIFALSSSVNTQKYLENYPKMIKEIFSDVEKELKKESSFSNELSLAMDFFSLLLDEKAVGKAIKGDALFLVNGISSKEHKYTSYDYDDEYVPSSVEKTEKKIVPEILMMFSSDDSSIIKSVLNYGIKKKKIRLHNDIYSFDDDMFSPLGFHMLIKNKIVFMSSSYEEILKIKNNSYVSKLNSKEKNYLTKNNFSIYFNPKTLINKMPEDGFDSSKEQDIFKRVFGNLGVSRIYSSKIHDNLMKWNAEVEFDKNDENSLKKLLKIIDAISDL